MAEEMNTTPDSPFITEQQAKIADSGNGVYSYFNQEDDIILGDKQAVIEGFFPNNVGTWTSFFTSSTQAVLSSSRYYLNVYQTASTDSGAEVLFDISYAKYGGLAGDADDWEDEYSASDAVYRQYASILLPTSRSRFTFADGNTENEIMIVNLKRDRLKEALQKGYWQLNLSGSDGSEVKLIDESRESSYGSVSVGPGVGEAYYIVSGTIGERTGSAAVHPFGIAYPDLGILVLNGADLATELSITWSGDTDDRNKQYFAAVERGEYFQCRNEEEISSTHYFVRAKNKKYNFSNNPTWITGSNGVIKHTDMWNNPKVYITTVGLYDDDNELLATAKLSKPIQKSFDRELLIKVRLDY